MDAAVAALSREIAEIERTAVTPVHDLLAGVSLWPSHPCRSVYVPSRLMSALSNAMCMRQCESGKPEGVCRLSITVAELTLLNYQSA